MKIRSPIARKRSRLEIIPLIDIMFFLLASFMMVSLQMQKVRTIKAALPTATQATSTKKPNLIRLKVQEDGRVELDQKIFSVPDLLTAISNRPNFNTNTPVYLSGSAEATHGSMMYVLDAVKRAGLVQVAMAVESDSPARPH